MPEFQVGRVTPVRAIVSAGRGLPALPAPRGVVEAVVSTACAFECIAATTSRVHGLPGALREAASRQQPYN